MGPIPILLPYHSHKNPLKYGNDMGGLWGPGVPLLGVPENPTEVPDCYDCDLLTRYEPTQ